LDFINTEMIQHGQRVDLLTDFSAFLSWLERAHIIDHEEAEAARRQWGSRPEGRGLLDQARLFRNSLRDMVERIVTRRAVPQSALEKINRLLRDRVGYRQVSRVRRRFESRFISETGGPTRLLVPLAEAAGDLLCGAESRLIKKCKNPACILYFYDTTKNHARSWCSMRICGNRMKVAAHYRRKRS
jgi:predicted RNA-binding Zn ribbon-like protein